MHTLIYTSIDSADALQQHAGLMEAVFPLHQSLRPHFQDFDAYLTQMQRVLADHARLLVVQYTDGTVEHVNSGEVSVRGLYGYV